MYRPTNRLWITAWLACLITACGGGDGGSDPVVPPPPPRVVIDNLQFANGGFSEVEIRNSFAFIVQEGEDFDISVEIDRDYSHLVSVTQEGARLTIEFDPTFTGNIRAQVARGIVTLPVLEVLELDGSAFVDIAGFNQSFLRTIQSGNSHIEGANSRIDLIDASLSGSSRLDLQGVSALPAANVALSGSSQATLNMMTGGTLTGTASGSSNLSYFGDSVNVSVQTQNTATVTWLGTNGG